MGRPDGPILVAGGDRDPNLRALVACLEGRGEPVFFLRVGESHHPSVTWELESGRLVVDGEEVRPRAAFVRYDVFTHLADGRPASSFRAGSWYTAVTGWLAVHEEARILNRRSLHRSTNKPEALYRARLSGLAVPPTLVTNHLAELPGFAPERPKIVKPINGGGHCQRLDEVLETTPSRDGVAASPAIVQTELVPPEVRVFGIGGRFLAFSVASDDLDYRVRQSARVEALAEVPDGLAEGLGQLMDGMGLDFGAADFKTCPETGRLLFLEINSGPMFAAFDQAAGGAVAGAIADFLVREGAR
ncbi:MAG: RimK family alpha-L-glutamate ligase [Thermoanaerobaculia bacterium]